MIRPYRCNAGTLMPTKYFVTRHDGAIQWAYKAGHKATKMTQFDVSIVQGGDIVIGTLPVHLAGEVLKRGGKYWHLSMEVPMEFRGKELTAEQMNEFGARLEEYRVLDRGARISDTLEVVVPPFAKEERLIHVVIASQQIVPNLLPALTLPCHGLCILVSEDTSIQASAELLGGMAKKHFAQRADFEVMLYRLGGGTLFPDLVRQFTEARKTIGERWGRTRVCLNVTGGTKPMALAATEAFAGGAYIVYCDTSTNRIECIDPAECAPVPPCYEALTFPLYLEANRYLICEPPLNTPPTVKEMKSRRNMTAFLARNAVALGKQSVPRGRIERSITGKYWPESMKENDTQGHATSPLARISEIGSNVDKDNRGRPTKPHPHVRWTLPVGDGYTNWCHLLEMLERVGLITILKRVGPRDGAAEANCVILFKFRGSDCARYVGGTWMEEFAALTARDVVERVGLDANSVVRMGVELKPVPSAGTAEPGNWPLNELDVAMYHRGRLLMIETKAGSLSYKSQDALNKLERLRRSAGGPFGAAWLLSARNSSEDEGSDLMRRARFYGIEVHGVNQLESFHIALSQWLRLAPDEAVLTNPPVWSAETWTPIRTSVESSTQTGQPLTSMAIADALRAAKAS
jgi:CRISPR-associated protein Csx16